MQQMHRLMTTGGRFRMSLGKGLGFAVAGAGLGAVAWGGLGLATGLNLWLLAPVVGGAAGYGMMRGTAMKGGLPAGALAALVTIVAIFATRHVLISHDVDQALAIDGETIRSELATQVADEWAQDDIDVYDEEEDDFTAEVYHEADTRWFAKSEEEQHAFVAELQGQSDTAKAFLTPLALVFDFGLFGTLCTALAAGGAFKTGSITLEKALVEQGHATTTDEAALIATNMREEDARSNDIFSPALTTIENESPSPTPATPDAEPAMSASEQQGIFGMLAKREAEAAKPLGRGILGKAVEPDDGARDAA